MALAIAAAILLAPAPQDVSKRKGELGAQWVERGNTRQSRVIFALDDAGKLDPAYLRLPQYDWSQVDLETGWYPKQAFAAGKEGIVHLRLTIGTDGKASGCEIARSSGVAALDAHACPHVIAYTRFTPSLDRAGQRQVTTVSASLSYELHIGMEIGGPDDGEARLPRAEIATPVTLAALGVDGSKLPETVYGVGARLLVDANGRATACNVDQTTRNDAFDLQMCARLMAMTYMPGRTTAGVASQSLAFVSLPAR